MKVVNISEVVLGTGRIKGKDAKDEADDSNNESRHKKVNPAQKEIKSLCFSKCHKYIGVLITD